MEVTKSKNVFTNNKINNKILHIIKIQRYFKFYLKLKKQNIKETDKLNLDFKNDDYSNNNNQNNLFNRNNSNSNFNNNNQTTPGNQQRPSNSNANNIQIEDDSKKIIF